MLVDYLLSLPEKHFVHLMAGEKETTFEIRKIEVIFVAFRASSLFVVRLFTAAFTLNPPRRFILR